MSLLKYTIKRGLFFIRVDTREMFDKAYAEGVLVPLDLRFDILEDISNRLPKFPIVLHGASSVVPRFVETVHSGNCCP